MYYFLKYRFIIAKLSNFDFIKKINEIDTNSSIPFSLSDIDPIDNYNMISNHIPYSNTSIAYSFMSENNPNFGNNTERFSNQILNKKKNERIIFSNNSLTNRVGNINFKKNNLKKRRTYSFGNLEVKMKKDKDAFNYIDNGKNHNNISYFNNNAFPPSTNYTTPNKYIYPIILNNKDILYNNNMNNNSLYNYQNNTILYQNEFNNKQSKPLLWYTSVFPSISQVSIMQDNNYLNNFRNETPKYINNSAYFNSITNINNSYSEEYLNKQIFDFINANSRTKQNIIVNIGKKHNIKLNNNNINKKIKIKKEKKRIKENSFSKNRNKQMIYEGFHRKNNSEYHDFNDETFQNDIMIIKHKKNSNLKIKKIDGNSNSKLINNIPKGTKKKNLIKNLKRKNIRSDNHKITRNYSIEISNASLKNNNDYMYENEKNNSIINYINKNDTYKNNQYSIPINYNELNPYNINNDINNSEDKKADEQISYDESLRTSLQSINDSKMLEIANKFIEEDKTFNKDTINGILNEKNSQKNIKINKY